MSIYSMTELTATVVQRNAPDSPLIIGLMHLDSLLT
jgi:hypothetical protein